jgi:putative hydrolase of the HAD superfamily
MNFKNIIFDLGAVIINIDYDLTAEAFRKLGLKHFDDLYSQKKQEHFFDRFEKGTMSVQEFREEVKKHLPLHVTQAEIDQAWNAMLIGIPRKRYEWLEEMGKRYRIFLLSNTNQVHIEAFSKIIEREYGFRKFESLFEKVYYSSEIGMRKPDAEAFELVLTENKLNVKETLFVDDSIQHIEGAKAIGLATLFLEKGRSVESLFELQQDHQVKP